MPRWLHWPDTINLFNPDGTFIYCAFSTAQLTIFRPADSVDGTFTYCSLSDSQLRPVDPINGTFVYCAFDLTNSGFDRTP